METLQLLRFCLFESIKYSNSALIRETFRQRPGQIQGQGHEPEQGQTEHNDIDSNSRTTPNVTKTKRHYTYILEHF